MSQTVRFNGAALLGLILIFAGTWNVFGIGMALLAAGVLTWLTALVVLAIAMRARSA